MKQNWEYKKLGDVCDILDSRRKPVTKSNRRAGQYPYYGATGIQDYVDGYLFDGRFLLVGEDGAKWGKGDNSAFIIEGKSWVNNHAHILKLHDEVVDVFIRYFLNGKDLNSYITGAVVPKLTQAALVGIPVPVPPKSEQERIVAELDLLNGVLDKQKAQLKELDTLAQSIFYDMFGDLEMKDFVLVDLCKSKDDIKCGPFGTQLSKAEYKKEGIAVWGIPQINSRFSILPTDFVTHEKAEALKDYSVIPGDIVMSRKGNVGQCSVYPYSFEPGIIHSDVLRLRLNENVANPVFMEYQLHLSDMIKHQIQLVSSGAIMPGINVTKLKSIRVQVPPLPLQQAFADKIASIEKQKASINQSIAETQKLLDYTMDKYFG